MSYITGLGLPPVNGDIKKGDMINIVGPELPAQKSYTQAEATQLVYKYGPSTAYKIIKGVMTIAQADVLLAATVASRKAGMETAQAAAQSQGMINTIVNTVKSNWLLFAIGGVLLLFGPKLFKSRR